MALLKFLGATQQVTGSCYLIESRDGARLLLECGMRQGRREEAEANRYALEIPVLGSLILTHSLDGTVQGLKDFPPDERPPVAIPFFAFRIMVGAGLVMLGIIVVSWVLRLRGRLYGTAWFQRVCEFAWPIGFVAMLAGWTTTEVGRQPWTVYGLLRTADSVAPLDAPAVAASLIAFIVTYFFVFGAGVLYILKLMAKAPEPGESAEPAQGPVRTAGITPAPAIDAKSGEGGRP